MSYPTRILAIALALAALLVLPAAGSASTTYGPSLDNSANEGCEDAQACTLVAFTIPANGPNGSPDSSGAPTSGVITKFRVRVSTPDGGPGTLTLRLARITRATPGSDSALATSAGVGPTVTVSGAEDANGDVPVQEFAARLPVKQGDHLAADTTNVNLIHASNGDKDTYRFAPPLVAGQGPRGSTGADGARNGMLLQVDIEPDRDGDGFGDETQDGCPSQRATAGACDTTKPTVGALRLAGRKQISFRLSEAATVKLTVQRAARGRKVGGRCLKPSARNRRAPRCTRFVDVKGLTVTGTAGTNRISLSKKLAKGRYRVVAVATDAAGNRSAAPARASVAARASAAAGPSVTGEFPLSETPRGIAAGPDGNVYVLLAGNAAGKQVARISPAGAVTEIGSPALEGAGGIVAGPDGNMWATLGDGVARFAPDDPENAKKFPIAAITDARGIAVGADGNLWVGSGENVVKVPPADPAAFTFTKVDGMGARGVARSGDLIWVADFGSRRLVRVTRAGVATATPVGGGGPQGVAGGPGGQVAYGNPFVDKTELGRLLPGGSPLKTPIGRTDPFGVVFGADGAYWFAQFATSNLGRLATDGTYTELGGLSAGSGPREIAAGPGGTLWLSLEGAKKVGRVSGVAPSPTGDVRDPDTRQVRPVVSHLELSRTVFRRGLKLAKASARRVGTTIGFSLSEPARVRLSFEAIKRGGRFVAVKGGIVVNGRAGANAVRFEGRLSRRRSLRPGRYRLTVRATDAAGLRSTPARSGFRLLPARTSSARR